VSYFDDQDENVLVLNVRVETIVTNSISPKPGELGFQWLTD
jgi:hypothetical protein